MDSAFHRRVTAMRDRQPDPLKTDLLVHCSIGTLLLIQVRSSELTGVSIIATVNSADTERVFSFSEAYLEHCPIEVVPKSGEKRVIGFLPIAGETQLSLGE